jgi:hypothetical protein
MNAIDVGGRSKLIRCSVKVKGITGMPIVYIIHFGILKRDEEMKISSGRHSLRMLCSVLKFEIIFLLCEHGMNNACV